MGEIRIASLNVNGARNCVKRMEIFETMKQKQLDVLFLQETHSDEENAVVWSKEWNGSSYLSHKTSVSGGVAILFARRFTPCSVTVEEIVKGRLLKIQALFENHVFVFICLYAPNLPIERIDFFDVLCATLKKCNSDDYLFLGGDFNCVEKNVDRNHVEPHMPSRVLLTQTVEANELCDVWRLLNRNVRQYTWAHARDNLLSLARLDRFYSFRHHCSIFKSCVIHPVGFSDHSLVICKVFLNSISPKSAYWHFNTVLLSDCHFKDVFKMFWESYKNERANFSSIQKWWDFGKIQIKMLCQQYTRNITKETVKSIDILEKEILKLQDMAQSGRNQTYIDSLFFKKTALSDLQELKAQGALVRSRFRNLQQMDVPSKFFFSLERRNGQKRFIHSLISETGSLLSDPKEIRERAVNFFGGLYKSEHNEDEVKERLFFENLPKVSEETNVKLKKVISLNELHEALQGMENGKVPGLDGIPVEFYKTFWPIIGEDLLAVLRNSLAEGLLPLSCRRAVITLLPKKGNLSDIKNWRPVSLLCCDYKLLSKVLAARLGKVLGEIIHPDQSYCVPGRSIFDNIYLIRDLFDVSRMFGIDMGLISLDQEKAFDRVEHNYLWKTFQAFNLSSDFLSYVKVLYCDIESVLKFNGGLCAPFKVCRGVRQGCSLSGLLYTLAIEPLLNTLRRVLEGVSFKNCVTPLCLSAYADDVIVVVNQQNDIDVLVKVLSDFNIISSARVNWNKSEAVMLGQWQNKEITLPDGLVWTREGLKYLGIFLGNETFVQKNWEGLIGKIKSRLEKWKWLAPSLSYRGRTLIINNLVASSLWHRVACMDPPSHLLVKIQSVLLDFFWDKLHWLPHSLLYLPKDEGGQGLIHLQSRTAAFRLQFIQRFLTCSENLVWKSVACAIFKSVDKLCLDKQLFLLDPKRVNTSGLPIFYRNLFKVWDLFKVRRTENTDSLFWLLEEPLLYGARLDIMDACGTSNNAFVKSEISTLGLLLNLTGPGFKDVENVAVSLGIKSIRIVTKFLQKLQSVFLEKEKSMLEDFFVEKLLPNDKDQFPVLFLSPKVEDCSGIFLKADNVSNMNLYEFEGKKLYKACVKAFNKKGLHGRIDTPWRSFFEGQEDVNPEWRALYKPPLTKRAGDLQWRVIHGIVAVNSFVSVLNPNVSEQCPFCLQRETLFHAFMQCSRLQPLFDCLTNMFISFDEKFTQSVFIFGFKYRRSSQFKCQLLNFILGKAKMAIYMSRREKMEQRGDHNVVMVFLAMVKSRILIDFLFYKATDCLLVFKNIWCIGEVLCSVDENEVCFSYLFI